MNKETRTQKIAQIVKTARPYGKQSIFWRGTPTPMNVYQIPLDYLVYNKYNGRILSRTKTLQKQGRSVDPETEEGKKTIEGLLWDSKKSKNEITKKDIQEKGQLKVGIITSDGIVIDGNRRMMLLNKIRPKYSHFNAIVLPVALEDDPIEVEKLETTYQMGEDEKQGYNPIEKYLKAKEIYKKLIEQHTHDESIKEIAEWMREEKSVIEDWLNVVKIIDDYLEYLQYDGIYAMADTPNDGKEDLFLYIKKWLNTFTEKESGKAFDGYQPMDVDELKQICFDYVRAKIGKSYDGKMFRSIADGQRKNHFFGDKKVWRSFSEEHFANTIPVADKINAEYPIDYNSKNIEAALSNRDSQFRDAVLEKLTDNLETHVTELGYAKAADKPLELVGNAKKAIDAIDQRHKAFSTPQVVEQIEELISKLMGMLKKKAPEQTLSIVADLLKSIELDAGSTDKTELLNKIKDIEKIAYQLEKDVKSS
ncbi:MAG: hypothetical protein DDT32_01070 [Syntrophomonadaceae bacterium]|nr:hypothetical protein [Bacillota bacterium]